MRLSDPSSALPGHVPRQRAVAPLLVLSLALLARGDPAFAGDTTPSLQLRHWSAQAGRPGDAEAGRNFFRDRHGRDWSCASCHQAPPTVGGKHASTGKSIAPLAPEFNDKSLTDTARVDKWFRRNCKDVLGRECSAQEKADVLAYLLSLAR